MSDNTPKTPPPDASASTPPPAHTPAKFNGYQIFVVAVLAFLQFTVILDFSILAPLGPLLIPALKIEPSQFGMVVSAYAFSACASAILTAGFADRFDRKRLLLIFYTGFLLGTLCCGLAPTFHFLLGARIVTGLFGGVIGSIVGAIVTDLFPIEMRGRVMGTIQAAFSASQIMGIPVGLYLGNHFGWHGPFQMIVAVGLLAGLIIAWKLKPLTSHLHYRSEKNPLHHLLTVATTPRYLVGFGATMLVATGGYMLQPFGSVFAVYNLGVGQERLPMVFMASGIVGLFAGPVLGRLSDTVGKFRIFSISTALHIIYMLWYTHLGLSPIWLVIAAQCVFAVLLSARMSSTFALVSGVPAPPDRGAYMAVSSSMQQLSGGVAAWVAGLVVVTSPADGTIQNYQVLGWIVAATMVATWLQMRRVDKMVAAPRAA